MSSKDHILPVKKGYSNSSSISLFLAVSILFISVIAFGGFLLGTQQDYPPVAQKTEKKFPQEEKPNNLVSVKGNHPTNAVLSTSILSLFPSQDGYIDNTGKKETNKEILVGQINKLYFRGILSFSLKDLDLDSVSNATLKLYQSEVEGYPYNNLGSVKVDYVDEKLTPIISDLATLSSNGKAELKEANVTEAFQRALMDKKESVTFLLRFPKQDQENPTEKALVHFESSKNIYSKDNIPNVTIE